MWGVSSCLMAITISEDSKWSDEKSRFMMQFTEFTVPGIKIVSSGTGRERENSKQNTKNTN